MIHCVNSNFFKMKNSILKGALNSFNAKKEASKDFEVIRSLESIKGGVADAALGCTNCKKKQRGGTNTSNP